MTNRKTKFLLWFLALVTIMACVPGGAAPIMPTIDPNAIGTYIVQTSNAAFTQTARALPTLTPTIAPTRTPRFTDTPEPTATSTVIFRFFTPTKPVTVSPTASAGSSSGLYACQVIGVTPANGTTFTSRTEFKAIWTVRNTGQKHWEKESIDYLYVEGARLQKTEGYDLQKDVKRGNTIDLVANMVAPKSPGSYTTHWTMRFGTEDFCPLSLTIVVP